jgi:dTDP-4-dehydrorhamnose reductase
MKFERVLITGCGGMLGHAIYPYFRRRCGRVWATDKELSEPWLTPLDVRDDEALRRTFSALRPDLVLHLAAETDLELCETQRDLARATNAEPLKVVSRLCGQLGATLVYISTAGVFDGNKEGFYTEADAPNPIMVYGRTKYEGELHARAGCDHTYVIRAGWMIGGGHRKDKKFVSKILAQIIAGQTTIYAVDDKWGTPTYTVDFANNLSLLLATGRFGIYHLVCEGAGTRLDIAKKIVDICGRGDIEIHPVGSEFFREQYFAPRPRSEMLFNANLRRIGINAMRPWQVALRDYISREYPEVLAIAREGRSLQVVAAD